MEKLKHKDPNLGSKKIIVAVSGGVDSVVLLHYLNQYFHANLRVIHCNHHLSKNADIWQDFCHKLCKSLDIEFKSISIIVEKAGNIEENARKKRYRVLADELLTGEILCTAHHQSDQAETVLLQLFRGSGVSGLSAMPSQKPLGKGVHYRPLLGVEKSTIMDYATTHNLRWIDDESNQNTDFRRNFLRLKIIPKLSEVYKNLHKILSRVAKNQAETAKLNQDLAQIDIKTHKLLSAENRLNSAKIAELSGYRAKNVIRYHISTLGFLTPSDKILQQMMQVLTAKIDKNPLINWHKYQLRRYQNQLYFIDTKAQILQPHCPFYEKLKDLPGFEVKYRQFGQRVKSPQKPHSQPLKKLLQATKIPPWERDKLRMYYVHGKLKAMEQIGELLAKD